MAAEDRMWFSRAVPCVSNEQNQLSQPHSRNTSSKHVQTVGIHYRDTVNMHIYKVPIVGTSKKTKCRQGSKLLLVSTKHLRMNLIEFLVILALRRTDSEIWGFENFPKHFRVRNFASNSSPSNVTPGC